MFYVEVHKNGVEKSILNTVTQKGVNAMHSELLKILCISTAIFVYGCDNPDIQKREVPINGEVSVTNLNEVSESAEHATHYAVGKVITVDSEARKIVVDLEPVPELNWTADTKSFQVASETDLNSLQTGEMIELHFADIGAGNYVAHKLRER